MSKKILIIMWYGYSRRAKSLSKELNADLLLIDTYITKNVFIRKYLLLFDYLIKSIITFFNLIKINPDLIIATSPPSFCPIICCIYAKLFNRIFLIDGHNSAFLKPWIKVPFYNIALREAKLVLVHNLELFTFLSKKYLHYNFTVLPDPLPNFNSSNNKISEPNEKYFLVILSFSSDEPINLLFNSIKIYLSTFGNENFLFYITGNYLKNKEVYKQYCQIKGIKFLGFLNHEDYEKLLIDSFAVITFSTKPMVQQSATIESLAASVPFISENSETNRRIFYKGVILTDLEEKKIIESINLMIEKRDMLKNEISLLRQEYYTNWKVQLKKFTSLIS